MKNLQAGCQRHFSDTFALHPPSLSSRYPFMIRQFPLITRMKTFHCPALQGARSVVARRFFAA